MSEEEEEEEEEEGREKKTGPILFFSCSKHMQSWFSSGRLGLPRMPDVIIRYVVFIGCRRLVADERRSGREQ